MYAITTQSPSMFKSRVPLYDPGEISFASPNVELIPACDMSPSKETRAPVIGPSAVPVNLQVIVVGPTLGRASNVQKQIKSLALTPRTLGACRNSYQAAQAALSAFAVLFHSQEQTASPSSSFGGNMWKYIPMTIGMNTIVL
jgi:hypothetical protein